MAFVCIHPLLFPSLFHITDWLILLRGVLCLPFQSQHHFCLLTQTPYQFLNDCLKFAQALNTYKCTLRSIAHTVWKHTMYRLDWVLLFLVVLVPDPRTLCIQANTLLMSSSLRPLFSFCFETRATKLPTLGLKVL